MSERSACSFGVSTVPLVSTLVMALVVVAGCSSSHSGSARSTTTTQSAATTTTLPGARPSSGCHPVAPGAIPTTTVFSPAATFDGEQRNAMIAANGIHADRPAPVVVLLHGMGQDAQQIDEISDFPAQAAEAGVIVVSPNAVGSPAMWRPTPDGPDARYIEWLLDKVSVAYCVDEARVYLAGFSVGAVMATTYACAHPSTIAAVATVAVQFPTKCPRSMPIIGFHGSVDPIVPYAPGVKGAFGPGVGTEADMAAWAEANGCDATVRRSKVKPKVERLTWTGCPPEGATVLYRIDTEGHAWPGTPHSDGSLPADQSIDATATALAFFARHHR